MSDTLAEKRFSRKSHRKSRHGCGNCKRRRVKCDEAKPCLNCVRHSIDCDFLDPKASSETSQKRSGRTSRPTFRFVHSTRSKTLSQSPSATSLPDSSPIPNVPSIPAQDDRPLSYDDFQLLHHYLTSPQCTFGDKESHDFWKVTIPEIGFKFHFVLHFLLALSALHLSREQPSLQRKYVLQAEEHYLIALSRVTSLLSHMDAENCQALYVSAMLICFHHFAKGPQQGDYMIFADHGQAEWLGLLRGVRTIISTMRDEFASNIPHGPPRSPSQHQQLFDHKPDQYEERLSQLRQFVIDHTAEDPASDVCVEAVDALSQSFTSIYENSFSVDAFSPWVFGWLYRLSDEFNSCLQQKQPVALVIFAHFTVLLKELEIDPLWFMRGWSHHVMDGINCYLHEEDKAWIQWPMEQLGYSVTTDTR
ncbi:hypothetical protein ASPWEDRAFT_100244 [Aspergillus wentii DTO 134E9]|uniref:Zn(2)-C6 fungal-type domain-containing protein n=1 Tax=Aspergillus wentii DTO 134E9 TaxID=1073089 RepID=A0A1L9S2X2_ASPWE|nr:uncharacterized protein ASPWEDRAFT_100244 [Aspergillus wentii DTO 134E9]KAI9929863.1 hypothetical protein MW887_011669 [Aspergillus wentii]OJJ41514.1 hypothetical protein ASPWEDRAFT_100244 [Aspergillus wentii DTO 134E9]